MHCFLHYITVLMENGVLLSEFDFNSVSFGEHKILFYNNVQEFLVFKGKIFFSVVIELLD